MPRLNPFDFKVTRAVEYEAPYGGCISAELLPVFRAFGLCGDEQNGPHCPTSAFSYMQEGAVEAAIALHLFTDATANKAVNNVYWVEQVPIDNPDMARRLFLSLPWSGGCSTGEYNPDTDKVVAMVHKATKELICYYAWVQGDGSAFFFTTA